MRRAEISPRSSRVSLLLLLLLLAACCLLLAACCLVVVATQEVGLSISALLKIFSYMNLQTETYTAPPASRTSDPEELAAAAAAC